MLNTLVVTQPSSEESKNSQIKHECHLLIKINLVLLFACHVDREVGKQFAACKPSQFYYVVADSDITSLRHWVPIWTRSCMTTIISERDGLNQSCFGIENNMGKARTKTKAESKEKGRTKNISNSNFCGELTSLNFARS